MSSRGPPSRLRLVHTYVMKNWAPFPNFCVLSLYLRKLTIKHESVAGCRRFNYLRSAARPWQCCRLTGQCRICLIYPSILNWMTQDGTVHLIRE